MTAFRNISPKAKAKPNPAPPVVTSPLWSRLRAWCGRNLTLSYTIMRTGDGEERFSSGFSFLNRNVHPWVFNRRLSEPMFRWSAALQVWLLNRYTTKFKFKVVSFKGKKK